MQETWGVFHWLVLAIVCAVLLVLFFCLIMMFVVLCLRVIGAIARENKAIEAAQSHISRSKRVMSEKEAEKIAADAIEKALQGLPGRVPREKK